MKKHSIKNRTGEQGFSLTELLAVLVIIGIMSAVSVFYFYNYNKAYRVEDQALLLVDILQEARQRALTQRRIMRVEMNFVQNAARLIDEREPNNANDDVEVKRITIDPQPVNVVGGSSEIVRIGVQPLNIPLTPTTTTPPEGTPVPVAAIEDSWHPTSAGHRSVTLRFTSAGRVLTAGTNGAGANAAMQGRTIYVWQPKRDNTGEAVMTRGITVIGATGTVRLWNFDHDNNQWARRG